MANTENLGGLLRRCAQDQLQKNLHNFRYRLIMELILHSKSENENMIEFPTSIIFEDIIIEIYGQTFNSPEDVLQFSKVAILASKNDHCHRIND